MIDALIHSNYIQEVKQQYEKWSADTTTLEIRCDDDPSPAIELDQQEQEVGPWTILPLAPPPQVTASGAVKYCVPTVCIIISMQIVMICYIVVLGFVVNIHYHFSDL